MMETARARFRCWIGAALLIVLQIALVPVSASAAELLMFERAGCVWCLRWTQEIGPIYPRSDEGKRAPLRRISLDAGPPAIDGLKETVFYTPTFVLMEGDREIGRITGYIGEDAFWGLLTMMIGKLPPAP